MPTLPRSFMLLAFLAIISSAAPQTTVVLPSNLPLPPGATVISATSDLAGNILFVGTYSNPGQAQPQIFAEKIPATGAVSYYASIAAGCPSCSAGQIVTDSSGNAYILGATSWSSFPTTAGVLETGLNGASEAGFLVKLDPNGAVAYSTLFGGAPGETVEPSALAVSPSGEAFLSGNSVGGAFPLTSTANAQSDNPNAYPFLMRISAAADRVIYAVNRGASRLAADGQGDVYVAETVDSISGGNFPVTGAAYQPISKPTICGYTIAFEFPCEHQYVLKLDPTGTGVLLGTFVSGSGSEILAGMSIDAAGNIYLAGVTNSTDYPTTPGALGPKDSAIGIPRPGDPFNLQEPPTVMPTTAYVTELNADGTALIYSTFLGGSVADAATALSLDSQGRAQVALNLQSSDFPGLPALPQRCLPDLRHNMPALATVSADGSVLVSLSVVQGVGPSASNPLLAGNSLIATDPLSGLTYLANMSAPATPDAISCITDGADFTQASPVSPGEVATIFGNGLASTTAVYDSTQAELPVSLGGASVLVNGIAAPLMYASQSQINFLIPSGATGQASIQVNAPNGVTASRTVPVVSATPSFFGGDDTGYPVCDGRAVNLIQVTAVNPDGSFNTCDHPAPAGSTVLVFLNGAGPSSQGAAGDIATNSQTTLQAAVTDTSSASYAAMSAPAVPLGVWTVPVKTYVSINGQGFEDFTLKVNGNAVREGPFAIWVH